MTFCKSSGSIPSGTTQPAVHPKRGFAADTLKNSPCEGPGPLYREIGREFLGASVNSSS
jgi:hypothetical protein